MKMAANVVCCITAVLPIHLIGKYQVQVEYKHFLHILSEFSSNTTVMDKWQSAGAATCRAPGIYAQYCSGLQPFGAFLLTVLHNKVAASFKCTYGIGQRWSTCSDRFRSEPGPCHL